MSSTFDGLSLTNSRDIKCNTIFLNYNNDIKNILDIFSLKSDISSITGLPPETLNTLQELANALNNNPDFFNYVNNQLNLKRNISDSYDKTYIDTLINLYYTKLQSDALLNNKLNLSEITKYYTKLQVDSALNNYYSKTQSDSVFVEDLQYNTNNVNLNNAINLKLNASEIDNYYTKISTNSVFYNKFYIDTS